MTTIHTIDLGFLGQPHAIASYLIRHPDGAVLIESGPGTTQEELRAGLANHGLTLRDVTHVLLTHIHLDHAGAAGWLAQQGALIHVHPVGAPHLLNPEKLLASAGRIYGDQMERLWGDFLAVPEDKLVVLNDGDQVAIGNLRFTAISTPGHAEHHHCYVFEDVCFSGDIGGIRIPGYHYLRAPMPPPELNIPKWRESLRKMRALEINRIAPTHFGIYEDPAWQLKAVENALDESERWLEQVMPADPPVEELRARFTDWMEGQGRLAGLDPAAISAFDLANPLGMSADGLQRYWRKVRIAQQPG